MIQDTDLGINVGDTLILNLDGAHVRTVEMLTHSGLADAISMFDYVHQ